MQLTCIYLVSCICSLYVAIIYLFYKCTRHSEAATRGALQKKLLLKISQISQENTCVRVSF